eukprot:3042819-Rhodomonas_salina.1
MGRCSALVHVHAGVWCFASDAYLRVESISGARYTTNGTRRPDLDRNRPNTPRHTRWKRHPIRY